MYKEKILTDPYKLESQVFPSFINENISSLSEDTLCYLH